jgi:hypothetical protein
MFWINNTSAAAASSLPDTKPITFAAFIQQHPARITRLHRHTELTLPNFPRTLAAWQRNPRRIQTLGSAWEKRRDKKYFS